jgi:hypothetical protein
VSRWDSQSINVVSSSGEEGKSHRSNGKSHCRPCDRVWFGAYPDPVPSPSPPSSSHPATPDDGARTH